MNDKTSELSLVGSERDLKKATSQKKKQGLVKMGALRDQRHVAKGQLKNAEANTAAAMASLETKKKKTETVLGIAAERASKVLARRTSAHEKLNLARNQLKTAQAAAVSTKKLKSKLANDLRLDQQAKVTFREMSIKKTTAHGNMIQAQKLKLAANAHMQASDARVEEAQIRAKEGYTSRNRPRIGLPK